MTEQPGAPAVQIPAVEIVVSANGPYEVTGPVRVLGSDGRVLRDGERLFLCRCGHSATKPYCDGSHRREGFTDDGLGPTPKSDRTGA